MITDEPEESGRSESMRGLGAGVFDFGKPWKGFKQRNNITRI